jgi:hypothetical protein
MVIAVLHRGSYASTALGAQSEYFVAFRVRFTFSAMGPSVMAASPYTRALSLPYCAKAREQVNFPTRTRESCCRS